MRTRTFLCILILACGLCATGQAQPKPTVTVKTKSGKVYSFLRGFHITETHKGPVRVSSGVFYRDEKGDVTTHLFDIEVDMGEFTKIIETSEVERILIEEAEMDAFKILVEFRNKTDMKLQLLGEWSKIGDEDKVSGVEVQHGEISIPLRHVEEIQTHTMRWYGSRTINRTPTSAKPIDE